MGLEVDGSGFRALGFRGLGFGVSVFSGVKYEGRRTGVMWVW